MQVLKEGVWSSRGYVGTDQFMDLIDVLDSVGVYPNYWDDVEKGSAFTEESGIGEDCCVDLGEKVLHNWVICLKGFCIAFTQIGVNWFEKIEGVIDNFIISAAEIPDANINDVLQEIFKGGVG